MSRGQKLWYAVAGPLIAVVVALALTSIVIAISGKNPLAIWGNVLAYCLKPASLAFIVNNAIPYFLAALAAAIGFQMGLFNIGIEGQYRLAAICAAAFGASVALPPILAPLAIMMVAMLVGALWAGIAGILKVTRGVSEVIATIMLNYIAYGLVSYLLNNTFKSPESGGNTTTEQIREAGRIPALDIGGNRIWGFLFIAALIGVIFHIVVSRSRFGYDLRASGMNADAALASGVDPKGMVIRTMLISGAIAGLVGLPILLGTTPYAYDLSFPLGLGFQGIAIALLGRNTPIGAALAALVFAFLDRAGGRFQLDGLAPELVAIVQGTLLMAAVIATEWARRKGIKAAEEAAAAKLSVNKPSEVTA